MMSDNHQHSIKIPPQLAERAAPVPSAAASPPAATPNDPFDHQIAGHAGQIVGLPNGILAKICPQKEVDFYNQVYTSDRPDLVRLRSIMPKYFGAGMLTSDVNTSFGAEAPTSTPTVHLENLLDTFIHPSVADIKIGTRLYGDEADDAKRQRMEEQARTTTSGETGLRICGMKVYDPVKKEYMTHDRKFGRALSAKELPSGVRTFFSIPSTKELVPAGTLRAVAAKLSALIETFQAASVRVYGASALLVYEGDQAEIRIIDFAHSHVEPMENGPDSGALFGLRNLLNIIQNLLEGEDSSSREQSELGSDLLAK
ncbi:hypothetical protein BC832DRAFT_216660 [Gaertneriomyces semiglobifer]|nr:hypothetical protein BC832DRAFT_216660 [Gaertneriomyces semiglobifer]